MFEYFHPKVTQSTKKNYNNKNLKIMLKYVLKLAENYSHKSIFITEIVKQSSKCKEETLTF